VTNLSSYIPRKFREFKEMKMRVYLGVWNLMKKKLQLIKKEWMKKMTMMMNREKAIAMKKRMMDNC
jgi:hypothetical protein